MAKKAYKGRASDPVEEPDNKYALKVSKARKPLPGQLPLLIDDQPMNPPKRRRTKREA